MGWPLQTSTSRGKEKSGLMTSANRFFAAMLAALRSWAIAFGPRQEVPQKQALAFLYADRAQYKDCHDNPQARGHFARSLEGTRQAAFHVDSLVIRRESGGAHPQSDGFDGMLYSSPPLSSAPVSLPSGSSARR